MTANRFRAAALLGAAAIAALTTAACTAGGATQGAATGNVHWQTVSEVPTATVVKQKLMFPNTNFTAALNGYDNATQMVDFEVDKWVAGGPDDGHYEADPTRSGRYRLPLAPNVHIVSVSTLCVPHEAPDLNGVPCTAQQLITGLNSGNTGVADIHVNSNDQIDSIKEDYVP